MPIDARRDSLIDVGLLSPVTVGHDALVSDAAVLDALVTAEVALTRAWAAVGAAPAAAADAVSDAFGWKRPLLPCEDHGLDAAELARAAVSGGNPVIPLIGMLKQRVPENARPWIHRGATSQDILDTALVFIAHHAAATVEEHLGHTAGVLRSFAIAHRDVPAAARTLTQHAVPTTLGARAAGWNRAVERANHRLAIARAALTPQLAGAAGTLAAFAEELGEDGAVALREAFAAELGLGRIAWVGDLDLGAADEPWHVTRWPITELGDALVQATDALGKLAGDVATLARTEIAELAEGAGGGSSAMPQKSNPVAAVLIRSAALRAPQLAATLHTASALAVAERPDGAWHAEWPTLRELLRVALGASAHARTLVEGLQVDADAVARNLGLTGGLIVSERLGIVLRPLIGGERFAALVAAASAGEDLATLVRELPEVRSLSDADGLDVDDLLDPARYTGLAGRIVDRSVTPPGFDEEDE